MKTITSSCAILLLFSCTTRSTGQYRPNTDVGNDKLNGRVKSMKESEYSVDEATGKKEGMISSNKTKFDINGRCTELSSFYPRNNETTRNVMKYNQAGKVAEEISYQNSDSLVTVMNFDSNGRPKGSTKHMNGKLHGTCVFVCDAKGNVTRDSVFNTQGILTALEIMNYDDSGNILADSVFNHDTLQYVTYSTYDKYRNKLTEDNWNAASNVGIGDIRKYDKQGNETEHTSTYNKEVMDKTTSKYENFDIQKNWLIKNEFVHGKPTFTVERVIEYW